MKTLTDLQKRELINQVREAQSLILEAIDILKAVVSATDDLNAKAYIVDHLEIMASSDHDFMSRDLNLDQWIDRLDDADTDDEDFEPVAIPEPIDPATFPHTQEFAAHLLNLYRPSNQRINAIKDYRHEYGVGLKAAKNAVWYIFDHE